LEIVTLELNSILLAPDFMVGHLSPKHRVLRRFKHSAPVTFSLTNKSGCPVCFQLTGQGETAGCHLEFDLPGLAPRAPQIDVPLGSAETLAVRAWVTVPPSPLLGLSRGQHRFTITATWLGPQPLSRSLRGWVETSPLIGPWLLVLLLMSLVVIVAAPLTLPWSPLRSVTINAAPVIATPAAGLTLSPVYLAGNSPPLEVAATPPALTYRQLFEETAGHYGLDWRILAEIAYQESRFNPWAIGRANEMGLMQIHPVTWNEWAPQVGVIDPYNPSSNVQVAAAYLVYLKNYCQAKGYTDDYWMLIGYNWGPDNLRRVFDQGGGWGETPEKSRQYAMRILSLGPDAPQRRLEQLESAVTPAPEQAR
jgi:hypothetical protein